jgi:glycosyltransferase involved in cell wall biosynthesis
LFQNHLRKYLLNRRPAHLLESHFPKVAVVIPTYNQFEYAKIAVESCLKNTVNCLVILVDDGSPQWNPADWSKYPKSQMLIHRFPKNDKNLTRSWNKGIQIALQNKCQIIVAANSDLKFPPNWTKGIIETLDAGAGAVGPMTNAPGHRTRQNVKHCIPNYKVKDSDGHIANVSSELIKNHTGRVDKGPLNGFCIAAKAATWKAGAFAFPEHFFNPKFKMTRNEDELMGRWKKQGISSLIACSSFVFHYRGVTRRPSGKGAGSGNLRIK